MTQEAGIGDNDGNEEVENQRSCPGRDTIGSNSEVGVCAPGLDGFGSQEKKDPDAV